MAEANARQRRAAARAERRAASPAPENEHDDGEVSHHEAVDALRTAASAAIAGAAVGAAQALARRRHADPGDEERPSAELDDEHGEGEDDDVAYDDQDDVPTASEEERPQPEREEERREPSAPPMSADDTRRIVSEARRCLLDLRGAEAESVSSVRRTDGGWCVGLEVVEVRRIPESTDVLATYEVTLDGDGNLVAFERAGRYYRSEAERR